MSKKLLEESALMETRYNEFISEAVETGKVWMLDNGEGVSVSTSNEFFDEEGEEVGVVLFWSKQAYAKTVAIEDWADYKPVAVDLDVFLEFSVIQVSNEDMLMGINWNPNMMGKEAHPIEIALEIINELEKHSKTVDLKHHKDLAEYKEITVQVAKDIFGQ